MKWAITVSIPDLTSNLGEYLLYNNNFYMIYWLVKPIKLICESILLYAQGGITCEAIDQPKKSSKAIDEHVIINFRDKNVVIARFCDKNVYR